MADRHREELKALARKHPHTARELEARKARKEEMRRQVDEALNQGGRALDLAPDAAAYEGAVLYLLAKILIDLRGRS